MSHRLHVRLPIWVGLFCGVVPLVTGTTFAARPTYQADPEYLIDTWETEDGLPENSATAMVQTPDGYLWFGTFNGLVRFDGVKFTVLDPGNTPQLPSAGIVNLHLDRRGWLWVSTYDGLVARDGRTGEWRSFGTKEGWRGNYVRSFAERQGGDLLLTTFDGHVLEFADGRLRELPAPGARPDLGYLAQFDESNRWTVAQQWFFGSWDGQRWEPEAGLTNLFSQINGCCAGRDGGSWLLSGRELLKLRRGKVISRSELPDGLGNPWSMTEDSAGNLWFATYDRGLSRLSTGRETRQWTMTNGLSYDSTRFVFEDRENNFWVGTSGGGLQRFKPRRFQSFGRERGLPERIVRCVSPAPDGSIWIATYGKGLCKLRGSVIEPLNLPGPDTFFTYTQSVLTDRAGRLWVATFGQSAWMSDTNGFHLIGAHQTGGHNVSALFEDSRGRIWMASTERVAVSEGDTVRLLAERRELAGVRCFAEDRQGVIWLSSHDGVYRLENDAPVEMRDGAVALSEICCMKADPDGTMWLGSLRAGLRCWRNGRLTTIGPEAGLPVSAVHDILEDRLEYFWLSSNVGVARVRRSDLLALADGGTAKIRGELFDLSDGLPSVECAANQQPTCARDAAGRLWFPTLKGVAMVDPARLRLNTLPPLVQIESVLYQVAARRGRIEGAGDPRRAALISGRGRPGEEEHLKYETGPRFRPVPAGGAGVASEVRLQLEAPFPDSLSLPAGSRRIEIHYTAPSFVAPEKVRFQVKLEGRDVDWQDARSRRVSDFEELPPGGYVFRVRAANNDGVWNETGASLAFVIEPFFWQRTWFRVGVGLSLLSAGGAATGWRLRSRYRRELEALQQNRRQQAELAHVARVSTMGELASSVAHELNQPLGAILSNAEAAELFLNQTPPALDELREILADIRKDDERAGEVIRRMRTLLRKREMEMTPLDLNSVVEDVFRLISADASLRSIAIRADLAPRLPRVQGDRVHLQQVLLNLIMNGMEAMAKLPSDKRRLTVSSNLRGEDTVELAVTDSGCGIEPGNQPRLFEPFYTTKPNGMGMGLSIARRIIEAHHGQIVAENNPAGGATFRIALPAKKWNDGELE